jgi:hypothetical protein
MWELKRKSVCGLATTEGERSAGKEQEGHYEMRLTCWVSRVKLCFTNLRDPQPALVASLPPRTHFPFFHPWLELRKVNSQKFE